MQGADSRGELGAAWILVFAKAPRPGECKSRLAATVGEPTAAQLAGAFLADTLETCQGLAQRVVLLGNQPTAAEFWRGQADGLRPSREEESGGDDESGEHGYRTQGQGTLGERLARAFAWAFAAGAPGVIAIGADTPQIPATCLTQADRLVSTGSAVLGPATDGGYYLLGLPRGFPVAGAIFSAPVWGEEQVAEVTARVLDEVGCPWSRLAPLTDIDQEPDLEVLRTAGAEKAPRSRALLARWDARATE